MRGKGMAMIVGRALQTGESGEMSEMVDKIVAGIGENFRTFGGDRAPGNNPIAHATQGKPLMFAMGVDVGEVVKFVIAEANKAFSKRPQDGASRAARRRSR